MSKNYIKVNSLSVSERLLNFVNKEAIEGTNLNKKKFWDDFENIVGWFWVHLGSLDNFGTFGLILG